MSKRKDIIDGVGAASKKFGLIYTEKCGWIDLGHAQVSGAAELWRNVLATQTAIHTGRGSQAPTQGRPREGGGFSGRMSYSQSMTGWGLTGSSKKNYYIAPGLDKAQLRSIALRILMDVSSKFETKQNSFPYKWVTDSGFSVEDLVSNVLGFYRAILPPPFGSPDYVDLCEPVSKIEAEKIWDDFGAVGNSKNKNTYFSPILYPKDKVSGKRFPVCGVMPSFLNRIQAANYSEKFKEIPD